MFTKLSLLTSDIMKTAKAILFLCAAVLAATSLLGAGKQPTVSLYFKDPLVRELVEAAAKGDIKKVDAAVKAGADVNARGEDGFVPLAYVMLSMNKKGFSALLEHGADPNVTVAKLPGLTTSLVGLAAQGGDTYWLEEMIKHKANLNVATSRTGRPPLDIAYMENRIDNVQLMLKNGANVEFEDEFHWTPLQHAASIGKWDAVFVLLQAKADWRKKDPTNKDIVERLTAYSNQNDVAHHGRFWEGRTRVAHWLKDHGANIPDEVLNAK